MLTCSKFYAFAFTFIACLNTHSFTSVVMSTTLNSVIKNPHEQPRVDTNLNKHRRFLLNTADAFDALKIPSNHAYTNPPSNSNSSTIHAYTNPSANSNSSTIHAHNNTISPNHQTVSSNSSSGSSNSHDSHDSGSHTNPDASSGHHVSGHHVPPPSFQLRPNMLHYKPDNFKLFAKEIGVKQLMVGFTYPHDTHYDRYLFQIRYHGYDSYVTNKLKLNRSEANFIVLKEFADASYVICVALFSSSGVPEYGPLSTSDMCIDVTVGSSHAPGGHHSATGYLTPLLVVVAAV